MALQLFPPWTPTDWTPQNDSLRGGSSTSALTPTPAGTSAIFSGNLDSKTLGGAGFASIRTTGVRDWDWRSYDGLAVKTRGGGDKTFTLVLKTDVPETRGEKEKTGETSTVSYEYNFSPASDGQETFIAPFQDFVAFYRGRPAKEAERLDLGGVKRLSLMVRSFFGDKRQEGEFEIEVLKVEVVRTNGDSDDEGWEKVGGEKGEKVGGEKVEGSGWGWWCAIM